MKYVKELLENNLTVDNMIEELENDLKDEFSDDCDRVCCSFGYSGLNIDLFRDTGDVISFIINYTQEALSKRNAGQLKGTDPKITFFRTKYYGILEDDHKYAVLISKKVKKVIEGLNKRYE